VQLKSSWPQFQTILYEVRNPYDHCQINEITVVIFLLAQLEAENSAGKTVVEIAKTQFSSGKTPSSEIVDQLAEVSKKVGISRRPSVATTSEPTAIATVVG
jgi:hypothetical protein